MNEEAVGAFHPLVKRVLVVFLGVTALEAAFYHMRCMGQSVDGRRNGARPVVFGLALERVPVDKVEAPLLGRLLLLFGQLLGDKSAEENGSIKGWSLESSWGQGQTMRIGISMASELSWV